MTNRNYYQTQILNVNATLTYYESFKFENEITKNFTIPSRGTNSMTFGTIQFVLEDTTITRVKYIFNAGRTLIFAEWFANVSFLLLVSILICLGLTVNHRNQHLICFFIIRSFFEV